jgi:hypothetical protein
MLLFDAGQPFAQRLRHPVSLDSQFFQDDLGRIVTWQTRDIAAGMAA